MKLDLAQQEVQGVLVVCVVEVVDEISGNGFLTIFQGALTCTSSCSSKVDFESSSTRVQKTQSISIVCPEFSEGFLESIR